MKKFSHVQVIAMGFALMIMIGTLLLMLPFASSDGHSASFLTAFFTATSSSCVTGLIMRDTATGWSFFGQAVILILIQIGGLGFMTIATFALMIARKRMGLRSRETMMESINTTKIGGIMKFAGKIVLRTAVVELTGALLLSIRFIQDFGFLKGLWYGLFHSVSAFCNAGFDLMGVFEPYSSLTYYASDAYVNIIIMVLITLGGLGFLVWEDVLTCGFRWKKYSLHSKLVLTTSLILTFGGAALLFIFERTATGSSLSLGQRILTALFSSVTARTAGFNTVDTASMSPAGKLLMIVLMLVGGSSGSTAGGAKTTTAAVIVLFTLCAFRGDERPQIFGRSISDNILKKSSMIMLYNISLALLGALMICGLQQSDLVDTLFETFSAIGTVGMTAGLTQHLLTPSALLVALLMYMGRVGSVSFAVALLEKKAKPRVLYPEEEITVG